MLLERCRVVKEDRPWLKYAEVLLMKFLSKRSGHRWSEADWVQDMGRNWPLFSQNGSD